MSERIAAQAYVDAFEAAWDEYRDGCTDRPVPRADNWSASVRQWRQRGLALETLLQFVGRGSDQIALPEKFLRIGEMRSDLLALISSKEFDKPDDHGSPAARAKHLLALWNDPADAQIRREAVKAGKI